MTSPHSKAEVEVEQIIERMRLVRLSSKDHVIDLQGEAKRLVDWKEYVRAKPILAVAGASLLGFGLAHNLVQPNPKLSTSLRTTPTGTTENISTRPSLGSTFATLAISILSNALRAHVASMMQRGTGKESPNDRL